MTPTTPTPPPQPKPQLPSEATPVVLPPLAELRGPVRELVEQAGCRDPRGLVEEMITTALLMGRDGIAVADLKLYNRALKEFRQAARVFSKYTGIPKVAVFGSARTAETEPEFLAAEKFARLMREAGYMIITGGGDGIMGAAQRGAGRESGFGLNIALPFEQRANETIHGDSKLINFNYFFTRKLSFVKETSAIALFPGGFGTMDEGFEVLTLMQTGKARLIPLVLMDRPGGSYWKTWIAFLEKHLLRLGLISPEDFHFFTLCESVEEGVEHVVQFYRNYHSSRYVKGRLVLRIRHPLTPAGLNELNATFGDVAMDGVLIQRGAFPEESDRPDLAEFPRIAFQPSHKSFGRLRQLIDAVNLAETEPVDA